MTTDLVTIGPMQPVVEARKQLSPGSLDADDLDVAAITHQIEQAAASGDKLADIEKMRRLSDVVAGRDAWSRHGHCGC